MLSVCDWVPHSEDLALNYIYSLITLGRVSTYIVAVLHKPSLERCKAWRLPCWDASDLALLEEDVAAETLTIESDSWEKATHNKVVVLNALLDAIPDDPSQRFYVHFADTDTVIIRPIFPTFMRWLEAYGADITFMEDRDETGMSTGHGFMAVNRETRRLIAFWRQGTQREPSLTDVEYFDWLVSSAEDRPAVQCTTAKTCAVVKVSGKAALLLHPMQGSNQACPRDLKSGPRALCGHHKLYVHVTCTANHEEKRDFMTDNALWLVDTTTGAPRYYADGRPPHPVLPCHHSWAWVQPGQEAAAAAAQLRQQTEEGGHAHEGEHGR